MHSVYTSDSCRHEVVLDIVFSLQGWSVATGTEFSNTICCTTGTWEVCTNGNV